MRRNERHVVKNPQNGWDIKKPHAWSASGHAQTKAEAVLLALEICREEGADCIIHDEDGKLKAYDSYGRYLVTYRNLKKGTLGRFTSRIHRLLHSI